MYEELVKGLRKYSDNYVAYMLDADFADTVQKAADAIEELSKYSGLESKAMDYAEDFMIFLAERRDAKGTEKQEVMACNTLWWVCKLVYDFLKSRKRKGSMK